MDRREGLRGGAICPMSPHPLPEPKCHPSLFSLNCNFLGNKRHEIRAAHVGTPKAEVSALLVVAVQGPWV